MELTFEVTKDSQAIVRTDQNVPVAGSVGYLSATFKLQTVDQLTWTPVFRYLSKQYKPDNTTAESLDGTETIKCVVPHEVIHYNKFYVSIFGVDPSTKLVRVTFPWVEVETEEGCDDKGDSSSDPSLTVYEKVLRDIQDIQSKVVNPDNLSAAIAQYFVDNPIKTLTEKDVEPWIATYVTNNKSTLKGDTGLTGAAGPKGDTGAIGPQGPKGDIGAKGADGTVGKDGADGYSPSAKVEQTSTGATITITDKTGTTSATVKNGTNGTNGKDGTNGTNGVSVSSVSQTATSTADGGTNVITVTLSDGTKSTCNVLNGTKGSKGDTGAAGSAGTNGKSAYELAVAGGYTGTQTEWIASLKGLKGDTGATGPAGQNGVDGATGPQGLKGDTGAIGPQGPKGDTGEIGPQGPAGADGKDGKDMTAQGETVTDTGAVTKALTANRFCNFTGAVTTLTITLPATYNPWDEFNFTFTTDSTGGNLAVPDGTKWLSGSAPTLAGSTHYEVSIVDGWAVIAP